MKKELEKEILKTLRTRLSSSIRREIGTTDIPTLNTVEFTVEDLKKHLDKTFPEGYNWLDFLDGILVLDHTIPCFMYNYQSYTEPEFKKCWNIRNFRLVTKSESRRKNKKLLQSVIKEYKIEDLVPINSVGKFKKNSGVKTLLINTEIHKQLEECSSKTGIKIKNLTEMALKDFLRRIEVS